MMNTVVVKTFSQPQFSNSEILRYAGAKAPYGEISALIEQCKEEAEGLLSYKACYIILDLNITGSVCDFTLFKVASKSLASALSGCKKAVIFAASIGIGLDRLILKYSNMAQTRALLLDTIGNERVEALCNTLCAEIEKETGFALTKRFSAGYGDLPVDTQRDIFALLDCPRKIGVTLNNSLLMSPSKSVTAFVGLKEKEQFSL